MTWRRALRNFLHVVAAFSVLGVGWTLTRLRTDGLADRLARAARDLAQPSWPRAPHVAEVLPGTFGERAGPPLLALRHLLEASRDAELCRAVRQGEAPPGTLTPDCLAALEAGRPAVDALLLATHAVRAAPPEGLGTLDAPDSRPGAATWAPVGYAAKLATLELWQQLERGDRPAAAATCLDLLALARDVSWGTSLAGRNQGVLVTDLAFQGCARALDAAPHAVKVQSLAQLETLQDGLPPLVDTMRAWTTVRLLEGFGRFLGRRWASLPPGAQQIARSGPPPRPFSPWETFLLKDYWHRYQARMDGYVEAAGLAPVARSEALARVRKPEPRSFNPLARMPYPDLQRLLEAEARSRAQWLLLRRALAISIEREDHGAWPHVEDLPEPLRSRDGTTTLKPMGLEARLEDRSIPRGELTLTLHVDR